MESRSEVDSESSEERFHDNKGNKTGEYSGDGIERASNLCKFGTSVLCPVWSGWYSAKQNIPRIRDAKCVV
jgi:hypothetical protein